MHKHAHTIRTQKHTRAHTHLAKRRLHIAEEDERARHQGTFLNRNQCVISPHRTLNTFSAIRTNSLTHPLTHSPPLTPPP